MTQNLLENNMVPLKGLVTPEMDTLDEVTMTYLENGHLLDEDTLAMTGEQEAGVGIATLRVLPPGIRPGGVFRMAAVLPPTGTRPTPALTTNMPTRLWT